MPFYRPISVNLIDSFVIILYGLMYNLMVNSPEYFLIKKLVYTIYILSAHFIGYLMTFILMVITMVVLSTIGVSELIIGLSSLGVLIPYYLSLFLLKDSIRALFTFRLMKE